MNIRSIQYTKAVVVFLFIVYIGITEAADKKNTHLFWINSGPSFDLFDPTGALVGSVSGSYQYQRHLASVRYSYNTLHYELFSDPAIDEIWDIGLLYGVAFKKTFGFISASTGIAYVGGQVRGDPYRVDLIRKKYREVRKIQTVGLPVAVQLFWTPFRFIGLGLYGFANINSETTYVSCNLHLQVGRLKTKKR